MWLLTSSFFHLVYVYKIDPCCTMYQYFIFCDYHSIVCIYHNLFISWWTIDCFYLLATKNSATVNIHVQICFNTVFNSLGHILRSTIAGSYGNPMSNFLSWTCFQLLTCFPQHLYQFVFPSSVNEGSKYSVSSSNTWYCLVFLFVYHHTSSGSTTNGYLTVAFICNSLMTNVAEYQFMCFLAISIFFREVSIEILCIFFN